jgi:hypothetical protein
MSREAGRSSHIKSVGRQMSAKHNECHWASACPHSGTHRRAVEGVGLLGAGMEKRADFRWLGPNRGMSNRFHFATRVMIDVERARTVLFKLVCLH